MGVSKMKKLAIVLICLGLVITFSSQVMAKNAKKSEECTTIQSGELYASDGSLIETGYDQWGYNYQARMFNGGYCDAYRDAAWCQPYNDVDLIMKWNDAWLSNKDCDGDSLLDRHNGFDSYIGSGAWLTNHQSGSYLNMIGEWIISFNFGGSLYVHDMSITDNSFSGIGGYPSDSEDYSHPWTVTGNVDGDIVEFKITYGDLAPNPGYTVWAEGTIAEDGSMSGNCTTSAGQFCTWVSTEGAAQECTWTYFTKIVAVPADAFMMDGVWYTAAPDFLTRNMQLATLNALHATRNP